MRRSVVFVFSVLALAGCGSKASETTTTAPAKPTLTSAADLAACNELETKIRVVSRLVSATVEEITLSLHPKQLAKQAADGQRNLSFAANALSSIRVPSSVAPARTQLVAGLRRFAADFGRAGKSVARGDMARAARQLVDRPALAAVTAATKKIDRLCGA
jgi:hypothetical protein